MTCCTNNFSALEKDLKFLAFLFTSNQQLLEKEVLTEAFQKVVGQYGGDQYKNSPYLFLQNEFATQSDILSNAEIKLLGNNTYIYFTVFETFISFLWLIKDNCCSINSFHTYIPEGKRVLMQTSSSIFSTSKGELNKQTHFSNEELKRALNLFIKGSSLFYHKNIKVIKADDKIPDIFAPRTINAFDFKMINRIERAFHFLRLARTSLQLPLKISLYMCMYEALFYGSNANEITHQIAERVALYAVNPRFMRKGVYMQIKEAYQVRSTYFHGNSFKSYKKDLSEISFNLDNLTRDIMTRVIMEDSDIFLQDDRKLENSFQDLLFEDERKPYGLTVETGLDYLRFKQD